PATPFNERPESAARSTRNRVTGANVSFSADEGERVLGQTPAVGTCWRRLRPRVELTPCPVALRLRPASVLTLPRRPRLRKVTGLMNDPALALRTFAPTQEFFVGIDSDGCVFDSMELKQKECFAPMFIKHFRLQPVSKYAREVWEFVNLYSKSRGINRYPALSNALNILAERPEVAARRVTIPGTDELDAWMAGEL